jgi:hypothetical protein
MGAYAKTGDFDDALLDDGDRGFVGVNQRVQSYQLSAGEVRESLNGRMEGDWRPRMGVVARTAGLTTGGAALQLPAFLLDVQKAIVGCSVVSAGELEITIVGHGFGGVGVEGYANIQGMDAGLNGRQFFVVSGMDTLRFFVAGVAGVTITSGLLVQTPVNDAANVSVRASCLFSDPSESNKDYAIVALDNGAKKIDLLTYETVDLSYPVGNTLSGYTGMMQVFGAVLLFRDGQPSLQWYPNGRVVSAASQTGLLVSVRVKNHGYSVGDAVSLSGVTGGTSVDGDHAVHSVLDKDVFRCSVATSQTITFGVQNARVKSGFFLSPSGDFAQSQTFATTGASVSVVNGLVSVTVAGNVSLEKGDKVTIYLCEIVLLSGLVGQSFELVEATSTKLSFYAPVANFSSSGALKIELGGSFSSGQGFMYQPGAPWGTYFQRRLWTPYWYDGQGDFNASSFVDRNIRDEIAVSDILDLDTFDRIENQFRITGGSADYVVSMHGFYEDSLVVLNRNSLHVISGTQGGLRDTVVKELTSEIGCLARKTVVVRGNVMLFLSDDGVYGLEFLDNYNLRGTDLPLSEKVDPYIKRINKQLATRATAVLFQNRYYLALPLDSVEGANDARGNNAILVFNFLLKGWESLDTFGDSSFLIEDFVVGASSARNNLYAVTSSGGLHQLEAVDSANDRLNTGEGGVVSPAINSVLKTRAYDFGTMERKRFSAAQVNLQTLPNEQAEYSIAFSSDDPDSATTLGTTTDFLGGTVLAPSSLMESETASVRCRLAGVRGGSGTVVLTRTIGSAKINSVKVTASVTNRQTTSQF